MSLLSFISFNDNCDMNHICQGEYHTAETIRYGRFLKYLDDNFLIQVQRKPTRKGTFQDLLLVNTEAVIVNMGEVVIVCHQ